MIMSVWVPSTVFWSLWEPFWVLHQLRTFLASGDKQLVDSNCHVNRLKTFPLKNLLSGLADKSDSLWSEDSLPSHSALIGLHVCSVAVNKSHESSDLILLTCSVCVSLAFISYSTVTCISILIQNHLEHKWATPLHRVTCSFIMMNCSLQNTVLLPLIFILLINPQLKIVPIFSCLSNVCYKLHYTLHYSKLYIQVSKDRQHSFSFSFRMKSFHTEYPNPQKSRLTLVRV